MSEHPINFVSGIDFVGGQYTDVGAAKLRKKLKAEVKKGLKRVVRTAILPSPLTYVSGQYPVSFQDLSLVEGLDFVGGRLTEVGATKVKKKIKEGLKKAGKAVGKVTQGVIHAAAKIVPAPYNIAFQAAAKITDKAASAVQKAKAAKAVKGLGALAKAGDAKAAATLGALKLTKDASQGKPAGALQMIATAQAKKAVAKPAAKPAARPAAAAARVPTPARPAAAAPRAAAPQKAPAGAFEVISPSGRRFAVRLGANGSISST